jgi:hypothetical protein
LQPTTATPSFSLGLLGGFFSSIAKAGVAAAAATAAAAAANIESSKNCRRVRWDIAKLLRQKAS